MKDGALFPGERTIATLIRWEIELAGPGTVRVRSAAFDELARPTEIGERVCENYDRGHQERSHVTSACKLSVDGERRTVLPISIW